MDGLSALLEQPGDGPIDYEQPGRGLVAVRKGGSMSKHPTNTAGDLISPKIFAQLGVTLGLTPLAKFPRRTHPRRCRRLVLSPCPGLPPRWPLGGYLAGYPKTDPLRNFGAAVVDMGEAYVPVTEGQQESAELPDHAESGWTRRRRRHVGPRG